MDENKVLYGLKNVYYAKHIVDALGNLIFAAPKKLPGAVSLNLNAQGEETKFYADDILYYYLSNNDGYSGDIEIAKFTEEFEKDIFGVRENSTDHVLYEYADAQSETFALMFEFSGDKHHIRHVLYSCQITRPSVSSSTKTNSTEVKTATATITASPLANGLVKAKTGKNTTSAVYNGWFGSVHMPEDVSPYLTSLAFDDYVVLSPAFNRGIHDYTGTIEISEHSSDVITATAPSGMTVQVVKDGVEITSGGAVYFVPGENVITITVTAADQITQASYRVVVTGTTD